MKWRHIGRKIGKQEAEPALGSSQADRLSGTHGTHRVASRLPLGVQPSPGRGRGCFWLGILCGRRSRKKSVFFRLHYFSLRSLHLRSFKLVGAPDATSGSRRPLPYPVRSLEGTSESQDTRRPVSKQVPSLRDLRGHKCRGPDGTPGHLPLWGAGLRGVGETMGAGEGCLNPTREAEQTRGEKSGQDESVTPTQEDGRDKAERTRKGQKAGRGRAERETVRERGRGREETQKRGRSEGSTGREGGERCGSPEPTGGSQVPGTAHLTKQSFHVQLKARFESLGCARVIHGRHHPGQSLQPKFPFGVCHQNC